MLGLSRFGDELVGRLVVQREALLDDGVELVALRLRHFSIDRRGVHQQGGCRQAIIVVGNWLGCFSPSTKSEIKLLNVSNMDTSKIGYLKDRHRRIVSHQAGMQPQNDRS